jgi:hypothetical protein
MRYIERYTEIDEVQKLRNLESIELINEKIGI